MQNKIRQLIISALKRNDYTHDLNLNISVMGYDVVVSGQVPTQKAMREVIVTIEAVSPHLRVFSHLEIRSIERVPAL